MRLLAEVRDEDDNDHDGEVVAAWDEATTDAGEPEAAFEGGDDHVDEAVNCHTLSDDEDGEEEGVADDVITALRRDENRNISNVLVMSLNRTMSFRLWVKAKPGQMPFLVGLSLGFFGLLRTRGYLMDK